MVVRSKITSLTPPFDSDQKGKLYQRACLVLFGLQNCALYIERLREIECLPLFLMSE